MYEKQISIVFDILKIISVFSFIQNLFFMNKIDVEEDTLRSWVTKYISEPDDNGYIFKFFKDDCGFRPYPFEMQNNIIRKKRQYIWKFIPETELIKNEDGSYCIKQKYIKWRLLKFVDINQLNEKILSDLLELFNWYIAFCKDEGIEIDIFGYQQDIDNLENMRKRKLLFYTRILNGFLSSTNIMISNDNKVYMVDVCDTIPIQKNNQRLCWIKRTIRQMLKELWIVRTKFKILRIIEKKRWELVGALS